ncbi:hypothetical protein GCM10022251_16650 [Phytohabitans flavus]|uniref:Uncharacterized protein n=1 Tax=Phytohabitans flavus TaxID=1076124 RepID=A0A6F8Y6J6_9ACTN|nr:hypothetical protein Pflav_079910 [Phytohabitans flavus]
MPTARSTARCFSQSPRPLDARHHAVPIAATPAAPTPPANPASSPEPAYKGRPPPVLSQTLPKPVRAATDPIQATGRAATMHEAMARPAAECHGLTFSPTGG